MLDHCVKQAISPSRLVKSPDSHASDPCSRLGGSSWLRNISFQSSMKSEKFISGATLREKRQACCQRANSQVTGTAVYENIIAEFNEIKNSSPYTVQWKGHQTNEAKSRRYRQFPIIKQLH